MTLTAPPEYIVSALKRVAAEGHECFLVGGCVRDAVMNRQIHDWDFATSATPAEIARLFPKTLMTGERFGTVTVVLPECSVEITTFRTEGVYSDGRHPSEVEFLSSVCEDLSRRDFTINAMAKSADGEIIDPFDGKRDINSRIIRCVGSPNIRFSEDALRMFRAFRFRAQLGFEIDGETERAIYSNAGMASRISSERVRIELEKTLLSKQPEIAAEMINAGLLDRFLVLAEYAEIPAVICVNKSDLAVCEMFEPYAKTGYTIVYTSALDDTGLKDLRNIMAGRLNVFAGPSGVGKSSLINALSPGLGLETGGLSTKLGRGKHTTRHTEIFMLGASAEDGYCVDTPGFTSLDVAEIHKNELAQLFPEFRELTAECKFGNCLHVKETGCAVKDSVGGKVHPLRYDGYLKIIELCR